MPPLLLLFLWLQTGSSFHFPTQQQQQQQQHVNTQLWLAYDGENDPTSSLKRRSIVPAGEEALHSAMMARSIRKMRSNRGLLKEHAEEEQEDEEILEKTRTNLLLTTEFATSRRRKKKSKDKDTGWSNVQQESPPTAPTSTHRKIVPKQHDKSTLELIKRSKRSNGMDLPYDCTIKALQVYYSKHGDLVMPRRYPVPESSGKAITNRICNCELFLSG